MSQQYLWNRGAYVQRPSSIISFIPNLYEAEDDVFAKIASGKVLININNHKEGVKVKARIDTSVLFYLTEQAAHPKDGFTYSEIKIFPSVEQSGNYKGLSPMSKLFVTRNENYANGKPNPSPWGIKIENGYAQRIITSTGGYQAKKGSYKKVGEGFFSMNDMEFYSALYDCREYVTIFKQYLVLEKNYLDDKFRKMEENNTRYHSHTGSHDSTDSKNTYNFDARILDVKDGAFVAEMSDAAGKPFTVYFNGPLYAKKGQCKNITVEVKNGKACLKKMA